MKADQSQSACHSSLMPKGPQSRKPRPVRAYLIFVAGALALMDAAFGPHVQAWYKTMPPATAKLIGVSIIFGLAIIVGGIALLIASRSSPEPPE
jgi:hypothetical protein